LAGFEPGSSVSEARLDHAAKHRVRVARWFVFKPKIPIWVNFGGSCYGKSWYILWPLETLFGHLVYFVVIWYIFRHFGILDQEKSGNPASSWQTLPENDLIMNCSLNPLPF
jgi:hypothetical protein